MEGKVISLSLWLVLLLFRGSHLVEIGCPRQCFCSEVDEGTGWDIQCFYVSEIPVFPSNTTRVYIHTFGTPDIDSGTFDSLANVESIMISGRIATIKRGAFRNVTGRETVDNVNQTNGITFLDVDIGSIESEAFTEISGFSTFSMLSFSIQELQPRAFTYFHYIDHVVFGLGSFYQIPTASISHFSNMGEILFLSISASALKPRVFNASQAIGSITFMNSTLGVIEHDALAYINCLGGLRIISCLVADFRSFALFGLDNVHTIEITRTKITKRTDWILEGIESVVKYDLQQDLVHLTPEQVETPSVYCLQAQPDPCRGYCQRGERCMTNSYRLPSCMSCQTTTDCDTDTGGGMLTTYYDTGLEGTTQGQVPGRKTQNRSVEPAAGEMLAVVAVGVSLSVVLMAVTVCSFICMQGMLHEYLCPRKKVVQKTREAASANQWNESSSETTLPFSNLAYLDVKDP